MNIFVGIALTGIAFMTAVIADAAPITWSFYETSCKTIQGGADCTPPQPFVLATLTLSDATSAGSALWQGLPSVAATYNGGSFEFTVLHAGLFPTLTSAFSGGSQCNGGDMICDFDLSWSEVGGQLVSVSITMDAFHDSVGYAPTGSLGLTGGSIASDNALGGCQDTQCRITGYWQSDLAVSEPISALLLATALLAAGLASYEKAGRPAAPGSDEPALPRLYRPKDWRPRQDSNLRPTV